MTSSYITPQYSNTKSHEIITINQQYLAQLMMIEKESINRYPRRVWFWCQKFSFSSIIIIQIAWIVFRGIIL